VVTTPAPRAAPAAPEAAARHLPASVTAERVGRGADSVIERSLGAAAGGALVLDLRTGGAVDVRGWDESR
jgi:hypothetical protein